MIIQQLEERDWKQVHNQIMTFGRFRPLMLQGEIDITYKGNDYILLIQLVNEREIVVLQATQEFVDIDNNGMISKNYCLIENKDILSDLLELFIFQSIGKHNN